MKNKNKIIISSILIAGAYYYFFLRYKKNENDNNNESENIENNNKMELPIKVNGSYKGRNCDELHAFESTGGRKVGGMNTKVNAELIRLYKEGINPMITDVKVTFDTKNMISNWEVTINKSTDGKAWVGLTSRGSSGDKSAYTRAYLVKGQRPKDIEESVKKRGEKNPELKMVKDWIWNFDKDKNIIGKCPTRQLFYSYTMPTLYPPHK
jgi:hypothetical protein